MKRAFLILLGLLLLYGCSSNKGVVKEDALSRPSVETYWRIKLSSRLKWRPFKFRRQTARPLIEDGRLFIGTIEGRFFAFDLKKKVRLWEVKTHGPVESVPATDGKSVFFGTSKGRIYAIRISTGKEEWSHQLKAPVVAAPLILGKRIFFKTVNGDIYAFNKESGEQLWVYTVEIPKGPYVRDYTSPVPFGKRILSYTPEGTILFIDPDTGLDRSRIRVTKGKEGLHTPNQPVVDRGLIYVTDEDGNLLVFDERGRRIWQSRGLKIFKFTLSNNLILILTQGGEVVAINKVTGRTEWRRRVLKGTPTGIEASDRLVLVSSIYRSSPFEIKLLSTTKGYLDILDLGSGKRIFTYEIDSGGPVQSVLSGERIASLTDNGTLHILTINQ